MLDISMRKCLRYPKLRGAVLQLNCSNSWNHNTNRNQATCSTNSGLPAAAYGLKFNPFHLYSSSPLNLKSPEPNPPDQKHSNTATKVYSRIPDHLTRPHSKWTPMMDEKLLDVALLKSKRTWKMLADEYFPNFTGQQIKDRHVIIKQPSMKGKWSDKEVGLLKKVVSRFGSNWMAVAKRVKTRNSRQCWQKWIFLEDSSIGRTPWTDSENKELMLFVLGCPGFKTERGIPDYSDMGWKKISEYFPGKTWFQCERHFIQNLTDSAREYLDIFPHDKGSWAPQQDEKLINLIQLHPGSWALISCKMRTRSPDQCQNRWKVLKSSIILANSKDLPKKLKLFRWTPEEDEALLRMYRLFGNKWAFIGNSHPVLASKVTRSIQVRFNRLIKKLQRPRFILIPIKFHF